MFNNKIRDFKTECYFFLLAPFKNNFKNQSLPQALKLHSHKLTEYEISEKDWALGCYFKGRKQCRRNFRESTLLSFFTRINFRDLAAIEKLLTGQLLQSI